MKGTLLEKFNNRVLKTKNCWIWIGDLDHYGYGRIYNGSKQVKAHRLSYELFKGEIPLELVLDHLCRHNWCVNPEHLEPKTIVENARRNYQLLKTHCPKGHKYDDKNTYIDPDKARRCIQCNKDRYFKLKAKQEAQTEISFDWTTVK